MIIYLYSINNINITLNEYNYIQIEDLSRLEQISEGLLLYIGNNSSIESKHFSTLFEIMSNNLDCLLITNHLDWSKGWVLLNLNNKKKYSKYLKYNRDNTLEEKMIDWLLLQPVNGLANRLRFLISSTALGYVLKKRIFLNWSSSLGFDQTPFSSLFLYPIPNLTEIDNIQFNLLQRYAFSLDEHIPGIINGLQSQKSYHTLLTVENLYNHNLLSIKGSNDLTYVFQYHKQFNCLQKKLNEKTPDYWKLLKPAKQVIDGLKLNLATISMVETYGFHIRKGETLSFNVSKTVDFLQIAFEILKTEPLAKFLVFTNCKQTLEFFKERLPRQSLVVREKQFLENSSWFSSYLDCCRPEGSSIEALKDLWLLSLTKKIFGTHDSSFSQIAAKWHNKPFQTVNNLIASNFYNYFLKGWSLVTCCMNRFDSLLSNIGSWLNCRELNEIIIIDWSSSREVKDLLINNGFNNHQFYNKIRIYRVENQSKWVLTWAYNLAFSLTRYDKVIKIDCDIYLRSNFLEENDMFGKLNSKGFYSGNWQNSNQVHLNGQVVVNRDSFFLVNGYNENITSYGYDDTDLYQRLQQSGFSQFDIKDRDKDNNLIIYHVDHNDNERVKHQTTDRVDLKSLIEKNRIVANKNKWSQSYSRFQYLISDGYKIYLV